MIRGRFWIIYILSLSHFFLSTLHRICMNSTYGIYKVQWVINGIMVDTIVTFPTKTNPDLY